jgi:hypothetical protein
MEPWIALISSKPTTDFENGETFRFMPSTRLFNSGVNRGEMYPREHNHRQITYENGAVVSDLHSPREKLP